MSAAETRQMSALGAGQMSAVGASQMSAVGTGRIQTSHQGSRQRVTTQAHGIQSLVHISSKAQAKAHGPWPRPMAPRPRLRPRPMAPRPRPRPRPMAPRPRPRPTRDPRVIYKGLGGRRPGLHMAQPRRNGPHTCRTECAKYGIYAKIRDL